jgi:DNA polymerase-3 subunit delta'
VAFGTIFGQEHALSLLQKALVSNHLGHAYLFYGPSGVGKKLTALQFAKTLLCHRATAEACDMCVSCHKMTTGNHPDVVVINPEGASIRIEHIRTMQRQLGYKPYEGQRTVIIIDGCENLTPPAANALLKTLEEPPGSALLLLLTSRKDALPLTLVSRCQLIPFRPLPPPYIREILIQQGMDVPTATLVATLSEGRVDTWIQTEISQVLTRRQSAYMLLRERGHTNSTPLFLLARQCAGSREQCEEVLHWLSLFCRDLVILKVASATPLYNHDLQAELASLANSLPSADPLLDFFASLEQLQRCLAMNVNPQLAFEQLVIQLQQLLGTPRIA